MQKELLQCALKRHRKESSIESVLSTESSPGAPKYQGYLSTITRLRAKVVLGNGRIGVKSFIVKDSIIDQAQGKEFSKKYNIFKIETMMYNSVLKEMEYLMEEFEDTEGVLWCNLVHYIPYSCIVLEDLKASGFSLLDRNVFFDLDHSLLAANALGRYHGMSKVLEEKEIISKCDYKPWFVFDDQEMHRLWVWNTNALIQGVKKHWNHPWGSIVDKIKITTEDLHEKLKKLGEVVETRFNILNHGDCHKNNIMFKYDWKKRPIEIRFLDFQIPHYGSPCCDLTFMFYLAFDPLVRRENFHVLMETYYESLIRTLERYHYTDTKPTLHEINEEMEKYSFLGLCLVLFGFPGMFISKDIDLFKDFGKLDANEGKEEYNLYESETFKKALEDDLKIFVQKYSK